MAEGPERRDGASLEVLPSAPAETSEVADHHAPGAKYRFRPKSVLRCYISAISGDFAAAKYRNAAKNVLRCVNVSNHPGLDVVQGRDDCFN